MSTEATNAPDVDPIMEQLEDQIGWYDRKSMTNQRYFKCIKMVEIVAAATIPFLSAFSVFANDVGERRTRSSDNGTRGDVAPQPVPAELDCIPLDL
jgi:hypothetical protein